MIIQSMPYPFRREEWLETLKSAFNPESVHEGHQYIYFNREGQCKAFSSPSEAHQQEFNQKMTIDDIITISKKYFEDYKLCTVSEIKFLHHAFEIMDKGAQQSWWIRLIHFLRGLGFKNTHELIDEQLLQIMDQKIQRQYRTLGSNLDNIKQILPSLNDERFQQTYEGLFHQAKLWAETPNRMLPKNYQGWKKREKELTDLVLTSEQLFNFSQRALSLLKQHKQLTQLLTLDLDLARIWKKKLEEIESSLYTYINEWFARFAIHDEAKSQQKFAQLEEILKQSISQVCDAYTSRPNYQSSQVDEILTPRNRICSPLRGIISLLQQLPEGKEENASHEWGED